MTEYAVSEEERKSGTQKGIASYTTGTPRNSAALGPTRLLTYSLTHGP